MGVLSIIKYLKRKQMALGLPHDMIGELRADRSRGLWWGLRHIRRSSERIDFRPATCRPGLVWLTGWLAILLEASWVRKTWNDMHIRCLREIGSLETFQVSKIAKHHISSFHPTFRWIFTLDIIRFPIFIPHSLEIWILGMVSDGGWPWKSLKNPGSSGDQISHGLMGCFNGSWWFDLD